MTLVFGGVIFFVYSIAQSLTLIPLLLLQNSRAAENLPRVGGLPISGFNLALAVAVSCPVMLLLCGVFAALRRGPSVGDYLALRPVCPRGFAGYVFAMIGLVITLSLLSHWLDRPTPEFITGTYATAGHLPFFWSALAIAAPAAEEVFFRGFLFAGLLRSKLGRPGTLLFTTLAFTVVHAGQYDAFELAQIALVGLIFGLARLRSGSLLPPLAMHITMNLSSLLLYALGEGP